jgi:hypothetical protein
MEGEQALEVDGQLRSPVWAELEVVGPEVLAGRTAGDLEIDRLGAEVFQHQAAERSVRRRSNPRGAWREPQKVRRLPGGKRRSQLPPVSRFQGCENDKGEQVTLPGALEGVVGDGLECFSLEQTCGLTTEEADVFSATDHGGLDAQGATAEEQANAAGLGEGGVVEQAVGGALNI